MKTGIELIADERQRQITVEGWTPQHDDKHANAELAIAGACYAHCGFLTARGKAPFKAVAWPWSDRWFKPSNEPIRNLVKAGALIAAEIDRLQRKGPQ